MRTIREELCVSSALDDAEGTFPRIRDMWDGITWHLARSPEDGACKISKDSEIFYLRVFSPITEGFPEVLVVFQLAPNLVSVQVVDIRSPLPF